MCWSPNSSLEAQGTRHLFCKSSYLQDIVRAALLEEPISG